MSMKWQFTDPSMATPDTYTFYANPTGDSPVYQKNLTYQAMLAPGAPPLIFEGQDNPTTFSVTGSILVESQYAAFVYWFNKRHPFILTDDTGRQRWIYLTNFSPVRKLSRLYPWRHEYTLGGYVISETLPTTDPQVQDQAALTKIVQELTAMSQAQATAGTNP
jgi:hypothetical protein